MNQSYGPPGVGALTYRSRDDHGTVADKRFQQSMLGVAAARMSGRYWTERVPTVRVSESYR